MSHNALAVAKRILDKRPGLTPMQLIKLVYICHGWSLGLRGTPLINEPVQAWQYGPVISSVYHEVKRFRGNPITQLTAPDEQFDPGEGELIDWVTEHYGKLSGIRLSSMTHMPGTPWAVTWNNANGKNSEISNDIIQEFYRRQVVRKNASDAS